MSNYQDFDINQALTPLREKINSYRRTAKSRRDLASKGHVPNPDDTRQAASASDWIAEQYHKWLLRFKAQETTIDTLRAENEALRKENEACLADDEAKAKLLQEVIRDCEGLTDENERLQAHIATLQSALDRRYENIDEMLVDGSDETTAPKYGVIQYEANTDGEYFAVFELGSRDNTVATFKTLEEADAECDLLNDLTIAITETTADDVMAEDSPRYYLLKSSPHDVLTLIDDGRLRHVGFDGSTFIVSITDTTPDNVLPHLELFNAVIGDNSD